MALMLGRTEGGRAYVGMDYAGGEQKDILPKKPMLFWYITDKTVKSSSVSPKQIGL